MKSPKVGDRVFVYSIPCVTWPGCEDGIPLVGEVSVAPDQMSRGAFYFLPDLPDPSTNGRNNARAQLAGRGTHGWRVEAWVETIDINGHVTRNLTWGEETYVVDEEEELTWI